jgi:hypothetical protein
LDEERKPSWLDEVSLPTKLVVVLSLLAIVGFGLLRLIELFL